MKAVAFEMELVLLHALPFDGSMWHQQRHLLPGRTHAPTLYQFGETVVDWARAVLDRVQGERLIVVGNSVGGSCGLEMAALAADRIAALVLVGAKAGHRPEPMLRAEAIGMLREKGVEAAWEKFWAPLFSPSVPLEVLTQARRIATGLPAAEIAKGVNAFHTRAGRDDLLSTLRCPVLCISGEQDRAPGVATTTAQAKRARDGRLIVLPDCGHYVPLEQPEELNSILQSLIHELA
jgi:pimeloyl-ACP methyl ester carboxylesterase